jgi:hypothetical protein
VPLIGVTDGDAVIGERPQLFDQAVVELLVPLAGQEGFGLFTVLGEISAVAPLSVERVGEGNLFSVTAVPAIFGQANLFDGGFTGEGRKWRASRGIGRHDGTSRQ